jgi:radical SAM-linked protein
MIANALPLGATSHSEIVEFELTQSVDLEEFQERLVTQLPSEIPVYRVEEVEMKSPAATQVLAQAEYLITVAVDQGGSPQQWQDWVKAVQCSEMIAWKHTTKSGRKQEVNLRDRLFKLELVEVKVDSSFQKAILSYVGSCRNDGTLLRPEHLVYMLEQVTGREFQLWHTHRSRLMLNCS